MSRFRKIEVRIWADDKFCALSPLPPSGQSLWLFLLTGPHTGPSRPLAVHAWAIALIAALNGVRP